MAFYLDGGSPSTRLGTPRQREDDRFEFTKGLSAGIDQTQALGGGLLALAGSAFGNDDLFYAGMDYYNEQMAEASESQADIGRIEDIDGFDDFLSWLSYTAGNALPSLATAVAGGGVGGIAARSAGQAAIKREAAEYAKKRVTDRAQDSFRKRVADDYTAAALSKRARTGAGIGAFTTSVGMGSGESFTRILEEEGEEAPGVALVAGIASGGLDAIAPMRALKRIFPGRQYESVTKGMAEAAQAKAPLYSRALKEMGKQAGVEGITEGMQEIVQNVALEYVDSNYSDLAGAFQEALFDESKYSAYVNAAAAGVVGGGVFGGASGVFSKDPVVQQSRVSREDIENENFDGMVADTIDRIRDEPIDQDVQEVDEADAAAARRKERQAEAQRNADAETRYGPLFDQIEARRKAQEILTREEEAQNEPVPGEAEDVVADQPVSQPQSATPLSALEGQNVSFQGQSGVLTRNDDGFFVVTQDEDIFVESGESQTAEALGISIADNSLQFDNEVLFDPSTSTLTLRGKEFTYLRTNSNADGNTVSIQVVDSDGNPRTIRDPEVVARVERLKAEGELPQFDLDLDDLPSSVQEEVISEAEQSGQEIPETVPSETAMEKAMKLDGYEREIALSKIDDAIYASSELMRQITPRSDQSEVAETENYRGQYRNNVAPPIDRAISRGRDNLTTAIRKAIADHNSKLEDSLPGTQDGISRAELDEEQMYELLSRTISTEGITTRAFKMFGSSNPDPKAQALSLAVIDLLSMGLPKQWLDTVDGGFSYYTKKNSNVPSPPAGFFGAADPDDPSSKGYLAVSSKYVLNSKAMSGQLRYVLAHEFAHAADHKYQISKRLAGFKVTAVAQGESDFTADVGELIGELYDAYTSGSELGLEFGYPFSFITLENANSGTNQDLMEFVRQEAFAQAFATFLSSPARLKEEAPLTYKTMLGLMRDPTFSAREEEAQLDEANIQAIEDGDTGGVLSGIRSSTQPGTDEGGGILGDREASEVSSAPGQASESVGATLDNDDGDISGPVVRGQAEESRGDLDQDVVEVSSVREVADVSELDPAAQQMTASSILYGNESPLNVGERPTVVSVATAFDERAAQAYPDRNLLDQNEENAEIVSDLIAHEALQAMNQEGNAGEWYQEKVANAMSLAAQRFPELDTDPNAKFAFTAIMAITSNGAPVAENSVNTFSIYEQYRDSKQFPDFGAGKEAQAMKNSFALLNELISENGIDSVLEFMDRDVTVKELKDNFGLSVSGELMGTKLKGSAILGPKIGGGFYQNLNGNFDPLTMDRWFMRTYGRLTGSLMSEAKRKLPAQIAKFREVALSDDYRKKLKDDGIQRVRLRKDDDYLLEYAYKVQSAYANGRFKLKNSLNKASNTLKNSQGEKQEPQNGTEREYIRRVMQMALDKVNKLNSNNPVNMGALQAIIWYPEKELYKLHGVGNAKSEPTDYETEFRKILEGDEAGPTILGPIRSALESGSGAVQRGAVETDADQDQVDGEEVQEPVQVTQPQFVQEADPQPVQQQDPAPEPPSPNQDLNAQIREENKPIFERVKKTFRRYLSPEGLLPKSVFEEKIKRDSELGAVEIDIRQLLAQYDEAVKTVYNRDLDEAEQRSLQEALTTRFSEIDSLGLDPDIKNAIIGMRRYLDNMSIDYAQILFDEAQSLASQGRDEKASAKIDLLNTIASNVGSYANRSYKAFDDPKWANNVPDDVLDDARTYLQERGVTNVENVLNNILKEGTAFDSMEAFIRESKLGAKDLTILKQRKDIAPQIRALLGEYVDPKINFTKSATKMSRLLFNDRFLKNVKDIGMDTFFFDAETAPPEAYVTFAAESSDVMAPLNGLRTTPEMAQAFQDALGKEQMEDWYRAIVQANGIVKYGKTVIAPTTLARNYLSAYMFTLANGHFNAGKLDQAFASMQSYFKNSGDQVKYLRRLKELGVVYDTPYAGEMMALLDDSKLDVFMDGKVKGAKFFFDNATKLYQYGDDLWKIVGFENEIDILMDAKGITREEAEPLAAKRIRDTYPTYSLVGRGVQKLRRFPLVGTFVSFPAEIIRTSFNMVKYLREDMNDPDMRGTVPRRVAGLAMVSAGVYALQEALMDMMDVDEEEEEAVRILGPKWSENSNLAFIGRDDGKLQYIDMSAFDPYNYFKRPINALLRDQPIDDAILQSAREALVPFFGADIAFQNIMEVFQNEKMSGGSVYNEEDSSLGQLEAISYHLIKGIGPSVLSNIDRTVKAVNGDRNAAGRVYKLEDEMAAFAGFRVSTLDPKVSLHFRAYDFNQSKRDATRILTGTFRDVNDVSDADLIDAFDRSSTARREAFEKMQKIVSAARSSGLNRLQIIQILRSNGVTKADAQALESGDAAQWNMSDSTLKNSVQKADLLFGDATGQEYERRWQIVQQLLAEENAR